MVEESTFSSVDDGDQNIPSDEKIGDTDGTQDTSKIELKCGGNSGTVLEESKHDSTGSEKGGDGRDNYDKESEVSIATLKDKGKKMENCGMENQKDKDKGVENFSVERVMRFLQDPSIVRLSPSTKESYLRSKGVSDDVIQKAMLKIFSEDETAKMGLNKDIDDVWENDAPSGQTHQTKYSNPKHLSPNSARTSVRFQEPNYNTQMSTYQQYQEPQHHQHYQQHFTPEAHQPLPELPNPIVPMTIGGMITLFGMAAFRWLNGDDFVIFPSSSPPPQLPSTAIDSENNLPCAAEVEVSNKYVKNDAIEEHDGQIPEEEGENNIHNDGNDFLPKNPISQHDYNHEGNQSLHQTMMLSNDLKNLSLVIEKFTALQERNMKAKSDEKARLKTNSAMELLKSRHSSSSGDNKKKDTDTDTDCIVTENSEPTNSEGAINLSLLVQITEFKCAIKTLGDQITTLNASDRSKTKVFSDDQYGTIIGKLEEIAIFLKGLHDGFIPAKIQVCEKGACTETDKCSGKSDENLDIKSNKESVDKTNQLVGEGVGFDHNQEEEAITKSDEQLNTTNPELPNEDKCNDEDERVNEAPADKETTDYKVGKEALLETLVKMQNSNEASVVKSCAHMLFLYMSNLSSNPESKQYRKIYTNNKTFKNKVGKVKFAKDVLFSVGFIDDEKTVLEWKNDTDMEAATALLKEAASLLKKVKAGESIS